MAEKEPNDSSGRKDSTNFPESFASAETPSFAGLAALSGDKSAGQKRPLAIEKTNLTPPANKAREELMESDKNRLLESDRATDSPEPDEKRDEDEIEIVEESYGSESNQSVTKGIKEVTKDLKAIDLAKDGRKLPEENPESFPHELFVYVDAEGNDESLNDQDWEALVEETANKMLLELEKEDEDQTRVEADCRGQFLLHGVGRFLCNDEASAKWYRNVISSFHPKGRNYAVYSRKERGRPQRVTFILKSPVGMARSKLERLIRAQNRFGHENFKIVEENDEERTDEAGKSSKYVRFHAIMSEAVTKKIRRKDGMFLKVQGRQPVRVTYARSRDTRRQTAKPGSSYAAVAARNQTASRSTRATGVAGGSGSSSGNERRGGPRRSEAELKVLREKWPVPMSAVKYWCRSRPERNEIRVAYKAAGLRFPFPIKCPEAIFQKLPKDRQEAMQAGYQSVINARNKLASSSKSQKAPLQSGTKKAVEPS